MEKYRKLRKGCGLYALFFTLLFGTSCLRAQEGSDDLFLRDRLEPVAQENIFKTDGYFNWGASIIKGEDGRYHMFYSRWKKEYTFLGWLTFSEVAHATAKDPAGPWKYRETVLTGRGKGHWDAITAHNPKIKFFEGYYISHGRTRVFGRGSNRDFQGWIQSLKWKILRISEPEWQYPTRSMVHGSDRTNH